VIRSFAALGLVASLACAALAQPPRPVPPVPTPPEALPLPPKPEPVPLKPPAQLDQPTAEERAKISKMLREVFLKEMPTPLVKSNDGWGNQKEFAVGKVMLRDPKRLPDAQREKVNDGLWRRFTVTARDPAETLGVSLTEMTRVGADKVLITLDTVVDVNFRMEQQLWKRGHQIYGGETRGHCKIGLQVKATVVHKTVANPAKFLPDLVLTVSATEAKLFYDNVVVDHTAGLDGEDAKKAGDFLFDVVKSVKPNLEKELLEKANAAIVKAVGTREFKIELEKVINAGKK
jgi:hypothetical protein